MIRNITALTFAACIACTGATAATYDFADVADGGSFTDSANVGKNGSEADWDTVVGAGLGILAGGISVIGSATNSAGSSAYAYFDSDDAGLGVCGNTGNCNPGNDDNVGAIGGSDNAGGTTFETLILTFSKVVKISQLLFSAEGHGAFTGSLKINGAVTAVTGGVLDTALTGSVFNFDYIPVVLVPGVSSSTNEFYISGATVSAVPVPASLPLLAGGLVLAGWFVRRRKA